MDPRFRGDVDSILTTMTSDGRTLAILALAATPGANFPSRKDTTGRRIMAINRRDLLRNGGTMASAFAAVGLTAPASAQAQAAPIAWDRETDVLVVGSGASGFPAAIVAREAGSAVIIVEAQPHIGGHGICSGGNVPLGGGTHRQKKYGIEDSPDLVFRDLTDWSVVEPNGFPDYRFNDREVIRAFADNSVATFDFLEAHGVIFVDIPPDTLDGGSVGNSVPRENHAGVMDWPTVQSGKPTNLAEQATTSSGNGLIRPLEAAAKQPASRSCSRVRRSTSAPARRSSSRPAARAPTSISAACSTRGSPRNIAASPASPTPTRTPAANSRRCRSAPRSGAASTRWASSAPA
jgi:hypothetical protein